MKKVIKSLILILVLAMAFAAAPAFAEGAPTTHNKVYQGAYSGTTADSGAEFVNEFASIVYGQLNGTAEEFGMEITFYGDSVWTQAGTTVTRKANAANGDGNYGIALIKLPEGYYAVRAYADGEYGEYVYFTVGESYKTSYTVNHYLETLESGAYEEAPAESEIVENVSIGATVTAESIAFEGYTYNPSASSATAVVEAGGTTVINLYYTRNTYEITYDYNGGTVGEATSETATQRLGTELTVSTNPTKEGAWFYGWSTTPYVNNINDVVEGNTYAPSLDTVEVVDATNTTYYAVWYEAYWLEFGHDVSNDLIIDYHTGSPNNHENEFYAYNTNWTTSRDGLGTGPLSVHTLPLAGANYSWFSIKLPKIPASEIAKVTISMKDDANGSNHYMVAPNLTRDDLDDINATSIPNTNWIGGDSYKDVNFTLDITNTIKNSPYCQDTLDFVAFFAQGYGHNHVQIESIYIDCAQDNTASFTTSVIKEQQDGSYAEDESLKYTSTAYIGTKALGNYKAIEGYTYDATQSVYATVLADGSAVAKRVYKLNEMNITYNYNGGTVGEETSETATVKYGSPLGVATNPTKEGAWFYGWATSADATVKQTVDTVTTATEYYAVWYEAKWLEFGDATTAGYITQVLEGKNDVTPGNYTHNTPLASTHSASLDGIGSREFTIDQMVTGGNYKSTVITMPKFKVADIDSLTIKMVVTKGESGNLHVVADRFTEAQNDAQTYGHFLAALQIGEYTFTVPQSYFTSKDWIGETVETLQFTSNGWANQIIKIDSIMINYKEANDVTATVVKQYYKQGADLQYTLDESLTETVTAYIGTPLNPAIKTIDGTEYNAEMSTIPATVAAGENVMSLYYDALPVTVTYHFNGGTNGTEATFIEHEQMGGSALADAETLGITKEGAYFYGWNTAANTLDLTTVDATATDGAAYYAVWYEESWLSFNDTDSNKVVFNGTGYQQSTSLANSNLVTAMTATEDTTYSTDGYLTGEFQLYRCQSSTDWAHSWAKINLPKIDVSKIDSITINAYFRVNATIWISANGRDYSTWNHASNYTGFTSTVFYGNKSSGFGTGYKNITITADSFTAVGVDTIESLYFDSHWTYQYIKFDSIVINWKA